MARSFNLQFQARMINQSPEEGTKKTLTYSRVLHLSHVIDPDIPQWSGDPPVEFETVQSMPK
jgi:hypothetical protein